MEQNLTSVHGQIQKKFFSPVMKEVLDFVMRVAQSPDTNVLIEGESGSGKEVIARMIQENSPRKNAPYITINCAAIPKDLLENELFGSEKGAFTGALNHVKKGKFELANRGTILLDEVGDLSLVAQTKLLRVIQERKYYRIGGSHEISVNIRMIATTNKNLEQEVFNGTFREDLFYRLNVARIMIPPLRERKEDIAMFSAMFLRDFCKKLRKPTKILSKSAEQFLQNYNWKGNVRELQNAIERVVLFEDENTIELKHFRFLAPQAIPRGNLRTKEPVLNIPSTGICMDTAIKQIIEHTLTLTNGNKVAAAKMLGITRGKLLYRIKQLHIA